MAEATLGQMSKVLKVDPLPGAVGVPRVPSTPLHFLNVRLVAGDLAMAGGWGVPVNPSIIWPKAHMSTAHVTAYWPPASSSLHVSGGSMPLATLHHTEPCQKLVGCLCL